MKKLIIIAVFFSLVIASLALAEFATTKVYFNIPANTQFSIAMPDTYSGAQNFTITATTLAEANDTDWISFNFSTVPQSSLQQPSAAGDFSRNQSGTAQPIFWITNLGNVNITITVWANESIPSNVQWWFNGTTTPGGTDCGTATTALTQMSGTAQNAITGLTYLGDCSLNFTMWANTSAGVSGGQLESNLITNSST
ncbi:MAG: hypothetical protein ACE5J4_01585 [Candidatus Aenigmatarchaeota archaeon]